MVYATGDSAGHKAAKYDSIRNAQLPFLLTFLRNISHENSVNELLVHFCQKIWTLILKKLH